MKNPLKKRLLPELKGEIGKYAVIFLMLTGFIGFISGFLVADGSMLTAYNNSFEVYNIEDGHFQTEKRLNKAQRKSITALGVQIYDLYYTEEMLTNGSKMRIFSERDEVNQVCLMEGSLPSAFDEIAIDRMYADNNGLSVGDTLENEAGRRYKITGLVAFSDYSCLFESNSDTMFDAEKFGVSIVTEETFASYKTAAVICNYAWKYNTPPEDDAEARSMTEDFSDGLIELVHLKDFVARQDNQAIIFTGEDMGSDRAMMIVLLYMFIAIMAFVFAITTKNTIEKEANVIGTLRASGYTRGELIRHYMTMPILVTLISAVLGNILGYTVFKQICAGMYYGSYSLPTYQTIWSAEALLLTTVVPIVIMLLINYFLLQNSLRISPLKFLRRDLSRKRHKRALPLNNKLPFFFRFRLRVIFQNMSNYVTVLIGVIFANLLLMFGLILPAILNDYASDIESNMLAEYQYMLNYPMTDKNENKLETLMSFMEYMNDVETENEDAEKFSAYVLKTLGDEAREEEVTLYGVQPDSRYVPLQLPEGGVAISSAYAEKYLLSVGDEVTLKEVYEDETYSFQVAAVYDYPGAITIFMYQEDLNEQFDLGNDTFVGYFSDTEITDIDSDYIGSVIDLTALTKVSRQLQTSMGSMMYLVDGFAIIIFMIFIYLLSKIIIEKNAQSISMAKILGYSNAEVSQLYVNATSLVVVLCLILSVPIDNWLITIIYRAMMMDSITGWLSYSLKPMVVVEMLLLGIVTYAIVAILEYRKVRKIPMDIALKNVE
ncbi:MAG: ABC transporter permease [Bacteroides sp.]|nr:ABC transporter permease [Bacteroides sp.]MCM1548812.1 ABC transporter permease [Clostridium sp.]